MNSLNQSTETKIKDILQAIRSKKDIVDKLYEKIENDLKHEFLAIENPTYGGRLALHYAVKKLKAIVNGNFQKADMFETLSICRYLFEMRVWLRLIDRNIYYGFLYYDDLLKSQLSHWESHLKHHENEKDFLNKIAERESKLHEEYMKQLMEKFQASGGKDYINNIMKMVDNEADKSFSIYADDAKFWGYKYVADSIEEQVIPNIKKNIQEINESISKYTRIKEAYKDKWPEAHNKKINWRDKASRVNLDKEYDFIYRYTSNLLHAIPSSMVTSPELEGFESLTFLRFINICILDILEVSEKIDNEAIKIKWLDFEAKK